MLGEQFSEFNTNEQKTHHYGALILIVYRVPLSPVRFFRISLLIKEAGTNRSRDLFKLVKNFVTGALVNITHHLTNIFTGLQILSSNVDIIIGKNVIHFGKNSRFIPMNMANTVFARM